MTAHLDIVDRFDSEHVLLADGALSHLNAAGVLAAADIHAALRIGHACGEQRADVLLAAALAIRAPRIDSVCVDLATVGETVAVEAAPDPGGELSWPQADTWMAELRDSPMVTIGEEGDDARPLRLVGTTLYLDRYWRDERRVAASLTARAERSADGPPPISVRQALAGLFDAPESRLQELAAATACLGRLAIIAGGPGTGKTTTIARILIATHRLSTEQSVAPPLVALAAPTGKAANRLQEAAHEAAAELEPSADLRRWLLELRGSTLHRLLGWRPGSGTRFRHNARNHLPHDVVIVDETSMVALPLMARLLEAVRDDARLILIGDPEQLASIEVGAVLRDIVGPAADQLMMRPRMRESLSITTKQTVPAVDPPHGVAVGDSIVVLRGSFRFGGAIAELAESVRTGDADGAMNLLQSGRDDLVWLPIEDESAAINTLRARAVPPALQVINAARSGDAELALEMLGSFRLLCAHRHGAAGASSWNARIERWVSDRADGATALQWYPGRPLLATKNDYGLRLFNGDNGVIVETDGERRTAVFARGDGLLQISPALLDSVETVYAMTIHKSQGSQFDEVAVVLPGADSAILTRELLYTAITRTRKALVMYGSEDALRAAIARQRPRASRLGERLWGGRSQL